jgi:phospholipid/cholesterol/gamma-HCH transport system substrate-binding protein
VGLVAPDPDRMIGIPTHPRRIAAVAALVAVVLALWMTVGPGSHRGTYEVTAVFDSVNGLVVGGDVRVGGFAVGKIARISMKPGGYPHVMMRVDDHYRLRRGSIAEVRLQSQAGQLNRYIALTRGSGETLADGATLGLAHTDQPVEIDDFLSALTPKTRAEVRALLINAAKSIDGHGPDIDRALRYGGRAFGETADMFADITADQRALSRLAQRSATLTAQLAAEPADLGRTVDRMATLLDVGARRHAELTASLRAWPAALRAPKALLRRFDAAIPTFRRAVREAGPTVDALEPFGRELRATAAAAPPAFAEVRSLVRSWLRIGGGVRGVFANATPAMLDLAPGTHALNPVLDDLRARTPDVFGWINLLGDATANYDAAGHGGRIFAVLTEAPRRSIRADECGAGWLERPFDRTPGALECEPWRDYAQTFVGGGQPPSAFVTPAERASRDKDLPR